MSHVCRDGGSVLVEDCVIVDSLVRGKHNLNS